MLWGVGLILLLPWVADGQGRAGALWAGLFTAISPAMVFYSRYYIHELGLVFFTFLAMAAAWRYARSAHWAWALAGGAGLGMAVATKETFVLQGAAALGGLALGMVWGRWLGEERESPKWSWKPIAAGCALAAVIWLVLFSSFFSNASGPLDSIRTYTPWIERADGASPHIHPWSYYLGLLAYQRTGRGPTWSEGMILGLGLVGIVVGLRQRREDWSGVGWIRFVVFYTLLLTLIYSVIPYKTPWCLLGFWHGWILLAGVGAAALVGWSGRWPIRATVAGLLLAGAGHLGLQAYRASYVYFDNPRNPYVYAHTLSSVLGLVERVEGLAKVDPGGERMLIKVMAQEWRLLAVAVVSATIRAGGVVGRGARGSGGPGGDCVAGICPRTRVDPGREPSNGGLLWITAGGVFAAVCRARAVGAVFGGAGAKRAGGAGGGD